MASCLPVVWLSIRLPVCLYPCLSVCISCKVHLPICPHTFHFLSMWLSVCLRIIRLLAACQLVFVYSCPTVNLSSCLSSCLAVCAFVCVSLPGNVWRPCVRFLVLFRFFFVRLFCSTWLDLRWPTYVTRHRIVATHSFYVKTGTARHLRTSVSCQIGSPVKTRSATHANIWHNTV